MKPPNHTHLAGCETSLGEFNLPLERVGVTNHVSKEGWRMEIDFLLDEEKASDTLVYWFFGGRACTGTKGREGFFLWEEGLGLGWK